MEWPLDHNIAVLFDALVQIHNFTAESVNDELFRTRASFINDESRLGIRLLGQEEPGSIGRTLRSQVASLSTLQEVLASILNDCEHLIVAVIAIPDNPETLMVTLLAHVKNSSGFV